MKEHETLVDAICNKVLDTLSLGDAEFRILEKFIAASKDLSTALGNRSEVYSLIAIENSSLALEHLVVAPIYSKLLLKAIDTRNIASDSACAALSDAFHLSRRVTEIVRTNPFRRSPLQVLLSRRTLYFQNC